jgi:hypothetical protein
MKAFLSLPHEVRDSLEPMANGYSIPQAAEMEALRILEETKPRGKGITTAQDLPLAAWRMGYIIEPRNPAVVALVETLAAFLRED